MTGPDQPAPSPYRILDTMNAIASMTSTITGITDHGSKRLQQRAIRAEDVERVLNYGHRVRVHGATRCYMNQAARRELLETEGRDAVKRAANKLDIFVVVSDEGRLITAGYRTRRMLAH
jgi:predicted DNA-binding protein (UPF0278 family)